MGDAAILARWYRWLKAIENAGDRTDVLDVIGKAEAALDAWNEARQKVNEVVTEAAGSDAYGLDRVFDFVVFRGIDDYDELLKVMLNAVLEAVDIEDDEEEQ